MLHTITVRNVNHALPRALMLFNDPLQYRTVSPRGNTTREIMDPVCTTYLQPQERVLFSPDRDANPFFHFFESLWILAGRSDVKWLSWFLPRIADYSDNGRVFHGAYGARMRTNVDQLINVLVELRRDPHSRRAVIGLWNPLQDSGYTGKDMPCNCTLMFKIREGALHMTVCNRSNDMLWGAYGANVVQFSVLQEVMAALLGVTIGLYHQFSDSFHVYEEQTTWNVVKNLRVPVDPYADGEVFAYAMVKKPTSFLLDVNSFVHWCERHMSDIVLPDIESYAFVNPFFHEVAQPLFIAHWLHKHKQPPTAQLRVLAKCKATDWRKAASEWITRRMLKREA